MTHAVAHVDRRRHKVFAVLRRHALLGTLILLSATAAAYYVGDATPDRYEAETVLIVPAVSAGRLPPGDPDAAIKLARTYSAVIPLSRALLDSIAQKAGVERSDLEAHLSATNDPGTSIIRIRYEGSSPSGTVEVLSSISVALVGTRPPAPLSAGTLRLVSTPDAVFHTAGGPASALPLGLVVGLLLAVGAGALLERTSPRVDRPSELVRALQVPVTTWHGPSRASVARLARHWFPSCEDGAGAVALIGSDRLPAASLEGLAATLQDLMASPSTPPGQVSGRRHAAPPSGGSFRVVAVTQPGEGVEWADVVVLVSPQGAREAAVIDVAAYVRSEGSEVSWAIFLPRGVSPQERARSDGEAGLPASQSRLEQT